MKGEEALTEEVGEAVTEEVWEAVTEERVAQRGGLCRGARIIQGQPQGAHPVHSPPSLSTTVCLAVAGALHPEYMQLAVAKLRGARTSCPSLPAPR